MPGCGSRRSSGCAPADSLAFWNRIDDDAWQVIDSDGDRTCGHELVTVDIYARVVAPRT